MTNSGLANDQVLGGATPHPLPTLGVVLVAAGRGERLGASAPKAFVELHGRALVEFDDPRVMPDGIALDAEGSVWVASPFSEEVIRVGEDGAILDRVSVPHPYAVALGGADGRDLFVCTADTWVPEEALRLGGGAIRRMRVAVPGAGL